MREWSVRASFAAAHRPLPLGEGRGEGLAHRSSLGSLFSTNQTTNDERKFRSLFTAALASPLTLPSPKGRGKHNFLRALQIVNRAFCEAMNPQPARRFH